MVVDHSPVKNPQKDNEEIVGHRLRSEAAAAAAATNNKTTTRPAPAKERWETAPGPKAREFQAALGPNTHDRIVGTYTPAPASPAWDASFEGGGRPFHRSTPSDELEKERSAVDSSNSEVTKSKSKRAVRLDISGGPCNKSKIPPVSSGGVAAAASEAAALGAIPRVRRELGGALSPPVITLDTVSQADGAEARVSEAAAVPTTTNPFGAATSITTTGTQASPWAGAPSLGARGSTISPIQHAAGSADTFTTFSNGNLMMSGLRQESSPVAAAVAKGYHIREVVEAEFGAIDVDQFTADFLQDLCIEANAHKKSLSKVEEKLVAVPMVQRHRDAFAQTRTQLLTFIRQAQRRICAQQDSGRRQRSPPPPRQNPSAATVAQPAQPRNSSLSVQLKHDRVIAQEHRLVLEMSAVVAESQALQKVNPEGDIQIQLSVDKGKDLKDRGAELAREALALYSDAVDAELGESAKAIYDCMQLMQSTNRDTMAKLAEVKTAARVGLGGRARDIDFPPPTFSGASDEDVYRFLDLFDQYLDARGLSEAASLRALQTVCLKGQLAITCAEMGPLATLKAYLLDVYGQPRALLDSKLKEFAKLGKCPTYPAEKRRDWLIRTQNQLNYLLKICKKFSLMDELMFSSILRQVHDNLTPKVQQEYLEAVAELPREERTRKRLFKETIDVVSRQVAQATADVNTQHILGMKDVERQVVRKAVNQMEINEVEVVEAEEVEIIDSASQSKTKRPRARRKPLSSAQQVELTINYTEPQILNCVACPGKHSHMYYCAEFQKAGVDDRLQMAKAQKACRRCLRMDSQLDLANRAAWFAKHEADCKTEWVCSYEWTCGKASPSAQIHMVLCKRHSRFNREKEADFIKSLDQAKVGPNTRFFFTNFSLSAAVVDDSSRAEAATEKKVIKTSTERAIYMMQTVYNESGADLLLFYDSGCSVAAISERAAEALQSRNLVPGPTNLNVAGGQVLVNRGGVDQLELELFDNEVKVQMRGLVMDTVTNPFALYDLQEAYEDLCKSMARVKEQLFGQFPTRLEVQKWTS